MSGDRGVQEAAALVRQSAMVAVLTGAGVSKESGVPTFRDALEGLWAQFDPYQLATLHGFLENPKRVWDWYEQRRAQLRDVQPNPGHRALAALEQHVREMVVITQNVDDLHERAGSTNVIHLHGNLAANKCVADCQGNPTPVNVSALERGRDDEPPSCPFCGEHVRPDVVWFGELLPVDQFEAASVASGRADVMLVVGTSGLIAPASDLPYVARQHGAKIIEVNPDETPITRMADIKLAGPSGEVLPRVLETLGDDA